MSSKWTKVFVYGTLKRCFPNHFYMSDKATGKAEYMCEVVTVQKFPLIIDDTQGKLPFLLNYEGFGKHVHSELFRVDDRKLEELNELEEVGNLYDAINIAVKTDGGVEEQCLCYVMHNPRKEVMSYEHLDVYCDSLACECNPEYSSYE